MEHAVLDAGRSSPVGNPFADDHRQPDSVAHAYDDWLALVLWFGVTRRLSEATGLVPLLAQRHSVRIHGGRHNVSAVAAWEWLQRAAECPTEVIIAGPNDHVLDGHAAVQPINSVAGAVTWLRQFKPGAHEPVTTIPLKAGDWAVADIHMRWPADIARELASFSWPITTLPELERLVACEHASPRAIMACEFTAAVRGAYEHHWRYRRVALSVDVRTSLQPGPHARMDVRHVIKAKVWEDAFMHPPCTHQVRGDVIAMRAKHLDGRTFWGIAFFIYCWCVDADRVMVEQPNTVIPDHYIHPTQCIRPCDVGDDDNKPIHLFERGGRRLLPKDPSVAGTSGHKRLRDFEGPDARDRWRSSWSRFSNLSLAVVQATDESISAATPLNYAEEIEKFACSWHDAGLPLPADYAAPDAQPANVQERSYQACRGKGDGRRVQGVVPHSRRGSSVQHTLSPSGVCQPEHCTHMQGACPTWPRHPASREACTAAASTPTHSYSDATSTALTWPSNDAP